MTPAWHPTGARRRTRVTYTRGYRVTTFIMNALFTIAVVGLTPLLLGPLAYAVGVWP